MHLVDEPCAEVLLDRRDAAAESHVPAMRRPRVARSSAAWMPSVTKWNVVPPAISIGARGWCVRTKTGGGTAGCRPTSPSSCRRATGPGSGRTCCDP